MRAVSRNLAGEQKMHQHVASSRSLSRLLVASVLGLALVSLVGLAVGFSVQAQQPDEVDITGIEGQDVSSAATRYSTHPVSSSTSFYETATIFGSATIPLTGSVEISPTVTVCGNGRITVTVWYTPSGSIPVNIEGANPTNANVDVGGISAGYMIFDISGWKTIVYKVNRNVYGSVDVTGSGPVTVTGSGPVGGETGVLVEGETQPEINVFHRNASIPNGTGSVDFGQTPVGIPLTEIFTVSNTGTCTLTLTEPITVPTGFSVPSRFGSTSLTAGDATTFAVRLNAAAGGTYSGTLEFASNDADENPGNFTLEGTVAESSCYLPVIFRNP